MTGPTGKYDPASSGPGAAATAAWLCIAAGTIVGVAGVTALLGHRSTVAELDGSVLHGRRRARRDAMLAESVQLKTLIRWHRRLTTGITAQGAQLHDRSMRGACARCGDLKGRIHECKDFGR